ncbi:DUF4391 domain-containing protein [Prevotella intermedia]|uniref:DUF4391 domain-containing protein n=1 Tax=Prevotella intermedia TaxID=28131 RepID=UPI002005F932|nr:DUF4391 domain-containing protein [Prevotella intermedia]MCK6144216.1 DUF4391 domain-containing protein [Prevotella intermedia]
MYALPNSTLLSKQIPKKAIFQKFDLTTAQRQRIDADIARIDIIARLAQDTLPAIAVGKEVKDIYVLSVRLKTKNYHLDSIKLLARLIPQRMLFVLCHEEQAQLAIIHEGLHTADFQAKDELNIPLNGLNFDTLWEQLVVTIGNISRNTEQTLNERIQQKKERERLLKDIEQLERRMDKERSLGKQMQMRSQINQWRKLLETIK